MKEERENEKCLREKRKRKEKLQKREGVEENKSVMGMKKRGRRNSCKKVFFIETIGKKKNELRRKI